jgi:hypothetical protein
LHHRREAERSGDLFARDKTVAENGDGEVTLERRRLGLDALQKRKKLLGAVE